MPFSSCRSFTCAARLVWHQRPNRGPSCRCQHWKSFAIRSFCCWTRRGGEFRCKCSRRRTLEGSAAYARGRELLWNKVSAVRERQRTDTGCPQIHFLFFCAASSPEVAGGGAEGSPGPSTPAGHGAGSAGPGKQRLRAQAVPRPRRSVRSAKMPNDHGGIRKRERLQEPQRGERAVERHAARDQRAPRVAPAGAAKPWDRVRPPAALPIDSRDQRGSCVRDRGPKGRDRLTGSVHESPAVAISAGRPPGPYAGLV